MSYQHEWEKEGVYVKFSDKLTSLDLITSNSQMVGKSEFQDAKYAIVDFNHINEIDIGDIDVKIAESFAVSVNPYNPNIKVALISTHSELQELIEKYIEFTQLKIPHAQQKSFENLEEARKWISEK